jgi:hypothetical protein
MPRLEPRAAALFSAAAFLPAMLMSPASAQDPGPWPIHSMERARPPVVDPGPAPPPSPPPSDAVVLFDGTDLSAWRMSDGSPARWRLGDGWFEVVPGTGSLVTSEPFGDVQLYIEWASPLEVIGDGQGRGNSGVFLMGRYEIQVLDSYRNDTYPDGQAAAVYAQYPPLVNASRPPGEWQSFDIIFRAPRFDGDGALLRPARVTAFHNGVLVHDGVELTGPGAHEARPPYEAHPPRLPLSLQDHGDRVRFRTIWIRPLDPD